MRMKRFNYFIGIFCLVITISSCGNKREAELLKIKELETKLFADSTNVKDEVSAYNLQVAYTHFAEEFPSDPEAPEYLFKAADLGLGMAWSKSTIDFLDKIIREYPDYPKVPDAVFIKAFVYDHQLNDDVKAGEIYKEFIAKYPDHVFAKDAQASLNNLGKSDEDVIREFEAMNADTTASIQ
jgi:TolA-binding protein